MGMGGDIKSRDRGVEGQNSLAAALLAGGENRRYGGRVKALLEVGGRPIIEKSTELLSHLFSEIVIVTNTPHLFAHIRGYRITGDIYRGVGPLGGLHAAMKATEADALFLVAGDMPFLSAALVKQLIESWKGSACEALIPSHSGNIEPLHAIYATSLLERLEEFISSQKRYAIRDFLTLVQTEYIEMDIGNQNPFVNINSPDDMEAIKGKEKPEN